MDSDKSIKERVTDLATINFSITKCPHAVYEEFTDFCRSETNDNYSMGLKLLIEAKKANIKEVLLFEQYMTLKAEFEDLKAQFEEIRQVETSEKPKNKCFGSSEKKI